ncbi:MAG: sugar MFS transporter [Pseudomonadales bacterium]|jgi:FHS family L-fucose permease-like MFS transporter|nr:sugar MFS transporter [Pseudomonadales bacterium]
MAGSNNDSTATTVAGGQQKETQMFAFIAMTCLFFFWGFITSLNDILIPHLKAVFDLSYTKAVLVQSCFFGAYFVVSPLAGRIIAKVGFQQGIVIGLLTTASGAALFYPSEELHVYVMYLFSFFILASGITILQVAANPYVAALGADETSASRLNLAQAANSAGTALSPYIGAVLILGAAATDTTTVQGPYLTMAVILFLAALVFRKINLPILLNVESQKETGEENLWKRRSLVLGALAIFLYVGGEVAIGSFLVSYFAETSIAGLDETAAGKMVAWYWFLAMVGRFVGAGLMMYIPATRYLAVNALIAIVMIIVSMNTSGSVAMWSILAVGFFNSIMFPTIFTLAVKGLGSMTSKGSGLVCQGIVGGALIPLIQGMAADSIGIQLSFIVPMLCYIYIGWYALRGADQS